jgi:hypothetical protein
MAMKAIDAIPANGTVRAIMAVLIALPPGPFKTTQAAVCGFCKAPARQLTGAAIRSAGTSALDAPWPQWQK